MCKGGVDFHIFEGFYGKPVLVKVFLFMPIRKHGLSYPYLYKIQEPQSKVLCRSVTKISPTLANVC
jgi:hypothetical protein